MDRNRTGSAPGKWNGVALRKESVDRNSGIKTEKRPLIVALRKESVDRNVAAHVAVVPVERRSPQGERG